MRALVALAISLLLVFAPPRAFAGTLALMGTGVPVTGGGGGAVTFDPVNKGTGIVLSGGNLTLTSSTTTWYIAQSTTSHSSGLKYVEFTMNTGGGVSSSLAVGYGDASANLNTYPGVDTHSTGYTNHNTNGVYVYNNVQFSSGPAFTNGAIIGVAYNLNTDLFWTTVDGSTWNGGGSPSPITGVGGFTIHSSPIFAIASGANNNSANASITANFAGPFNWSSAYTSLSGIGYTTW
jgi:hypothetical protein